MKLFQLGGYYEVETKEGKNKGKVRICNAPMWTCFLGEVLYWMDSYGNRVYRVVKGQDGMILDEGF